MNKKRSKKYHVLDLFSGCGGLSLGFSDAGYKIIGAIDNWEDALLTFKKNHPGGKTDLADLGREKPEAVLRRMKIVPGSVGVVVGGPPCQGFSISGKRNPEDPRNRLYEAFIDFVRVLKPKAFVMENVPNLVSIQEGKIKDAILSDFKKCGYGVEYKILRASDFGVPQNRRRVFFVGLRNNGSFCFPLGDFGDGLSAKLRISTKEAIGDLPEKTLEDGSRYPRPAVGAYQIQMRKESRGVFNHEVIVHTEKTQRIISMVSDGGNYKDLPKELHSIRKVNIAWTRLNSGKPSYTIDTGHNHIFHYKFNRVPTASESARIQSFPDDFIFFGKEQGEPSETDRQCGTADARKRRCERTAKIYPMIYQTPEKYFF